MSKLMKTPFAAADFRIGTIRSMLAAMQRSNAIGSVRAERLLTLMETFVRGTAPR